MLGVAFQLAESVVQQRQKSPQTLGVQVAQHKWAEEGAELKGRLTAHEAQLEVMQVVLSHHHQNTLLGFFPASKRGRSVLLPLRPRVTFW